MSLLRFAARSMLASFFVVNGAKALANPGPLVSEAEPIARTFVPLVQKVAPPTLANYIPDDTVTLVRATGAAQVAGGLMLATGIFRRTGATLLGLSMIPHVLASRADKNATADERAASRAKLQRNVALLGGAILAALDTQGKPGLAWLAADRRRRLTEAGERTGKSLAKAGERTGRQLAKDTKSARKSVARELKLAGKSAQLTARDAQRTLENALS